MWTKQHFPLKAMGALGAGAASLLAVVLAQPTREPVYVGARACATCHDGPGMGHQFSKWLLTKHSRAYSVLSKPEAQEIARLSGVPQEPQESPVCLGCHATAADTEDWEREPGFFIQDGVQCEKCHGPGSEYMDAETMSNREAAMRAGLRMPTRDLCMVCHNEKGSHLAVHKLPKLDMEKAWQTISHKRPPEPRHQATPVPTGMAAETAGTPLYVGTMSCAQCHRAAAMGFQFSRWKLSPHSQAWARLASPEAARIAADMGVIGNPQQAPECLRCHTTAGTRLDAAMPSYSVDEGVGCEACHGPGSEYQPEAVMLDRASAIRAGLKMGGRETCDGCHQNAHDKPFDYDTAVAMISHPTRPRDQVAEVRYKTPLNLAVTPDGSRLFVTCEEGDSVIVLDTRSRTRIAEIPVGGQPNSVAFSPDGRLAWVTNRLDDTLTEIDVAGLKVLRTVRVGDEPHGVISDREGRYLYVLNTSEESISVLDAATLKETKRLAASRYPWAVSLSPDGSRIIVTHALSRLVGLREPSVSELTLIDTGSATVEERLDVPDTNLLSAVQWHPSGKYALFTLMRTKSLIPMTRLTQGWTITNGVGIAWEDGRIDQVLLDSPEIGFPDPAALVITPDGRLAFISSTTLHRVAVLDLDKLVALVNSADPYERSEVLPNLLGTSTDFVLKFIETERSPRGLALSPDGRQVYVAASLADAVQVIDVDRLEVTATIDLGGPKQITKARFGERLFHDAKITFRRQFSCHSCHPDGHVDGITYDIEADGVGVNPVDNRTLRGILDTAPFKWNGKNPSLRRQCGARLSVFFTRLAPFNEEELAAIDYYIATIRRPPNRYRALGVELTPAQRRGKMLFERTMTNTGKPIPPEGQCVFCHPAPLYTNRRIFDVGTKMKHDTDGRFDVPHLNNIYDSAPYLHNGAAKTLEEIWTVYNPYDTHGVTNDMTKDQLNDLIEYIKTF